MCKHVKPGRRALVKEFYANLVERRNLTCYVRGRWVPFGERIISQLFGLREGGVKGFELNVGRIIEESILAYVESKFSGNIPPLLNHPHVHQRREGVGGCV